ncbi:DGQHR domain-containing protein [Acinetobacter sp. ANC 4216]|uniref:DGQHR domain-containing protein n=1 Tax=Acinetobacter sp. ANC 4216 TaxID=2529840 RepID=UPI00103DADE1|nr:DGQHR domain-containing protein [Acinetobacter sp. ANC 4216]TCB66778.1 DGQHR domain-containing protein [Acinetobacter sp. ANC 4216]
MNNNLVLKAFDISHNDTRCYISKMNGKELKNIAKISRVDEEQNGYQRLLDERRSRAIGKYIDEGYLLPGSIILSYKGNFDYNEFTNELVLNIQNDNLLVLDGQHRLYGAFLAQSDIELPICLLCNLTIKQEIQYFLDINSNQKGVPKTLQQELTKYLLDNETSPEAIRLALFDRFYTDENSPLYGRMTKTQSVVGKVSHVPFEKAISPLLSNSDSYLSMFKTLDEKYILLNNYLKAFSSVLEEIHNNDNLVSQAAFFESMFKVFDKVCSVSHINLKNLKEESLYQVISCIKSLDFEKHTGSNKQAISNLSNEMITLIDAYSHAKFTNNGMDLL